MCRQSATVCLIKSPSRQHREVGDLAARLRALPDRRGRRGRRQALGAVLLTACCVVLTGACSYLAIGQWARSAPQDALARLGVRAIGPLWGSGRRRDGGRGRQERPRLAHRRRPGRVSAGRPHRHRTGHHLAAGAGQNHRGDQLRPLLAPFDLAGCVVSADALHTQRAHAHFLVEEKQAHYLLLVKRNQPRLHAALRALPWSRCTARRYNREVGHGRRETRVTRVLTVTSLELGFPHVVQAAKILRHRTDRKTGKVTRQTVYAITALTAGQASPSGSASWPARSG